MVERVCLGDGSFAGSRSHEEWIADGFREDPSVFEECDTFHAGLRCEVDRFYDEVDALLLGVAV